VCDANGTSRATAAHLWLHGEMLPATYIENAGEAGASPANIGTAGSEHRVQYTAPLPACQLL